MAIQSAERSRGLAAIGQGAADAAALDTGAAARAVTLRLLSGRKNNRHHLVPRQSLILA
jgi:hypothetical protein